MALPPPPPGSLPLARRLNARSLGRELFTWLLSAKWGRSFEETDDALDAAAACALETRGRMGCEVPPGVDPAFYRMVEREAVRTMPFTGPLWFWFTFRRSIPLEGAEFALEAPDVRKAVMDALTSGRDWAQALATVAAAFGVGTLESLRGETLAIGQAIAGGLTLARDLAEGGVEALDRALRRAEKELKALPERLPPVPPVPPIPVPELPPVPTLPSGERLLEAARETFKVPDPESEFFRLPPAETEPVLGAARWLWDNTFGRLF